MFRKSARVALTVLVSMLNLTTAGGLPNRKMDGEPTAIPPRGSGIASLPGVARRDPQVENDNPITIESDPNSGNTITVDPDGPQPKCATPTDGQDMTISDDSEQIANVAEYGSGTQDDPEDKPGPVAPPGGIVLSG